MLEPIVPYICSDLAKKEQVAGMFNQIAETYDFLNHMLSFGIDRYWRKKAIKTLLDHAPKYILDVATGTGDFAFQAIKILHPAHIIGVDISEGMLRIADKKIIKKKLTAVFEICVGDSERLLFEDNAFDAVTVAYGVRNFENLEKGLSDMLRVLKPGGKVLILEFSKPKMCVIKQIYHFYFNWFVPVLGMLFSKDASAYAYLPASVASFSDGEAFVQKMCDIGFKNTEYTPLTFGICSIYTGFK